MNKTPVIQRALHKSGLYLKKYSPVALSCVASVGVIVTVVTAVKATPKAVELVKADSRKNHDGDPYAYTKKKRRLCQRGNVIFRPLLLAFPR